MADPSLDPTAYEFVRFTPSREWGAAMADHAVRRLAGINRTVRSG